MRTLEKIALDFQVKTAGRPMRLGNLPLASLRIDDTYQRDVGPQGLKHVRKIAEKFSWSKFSPVIVTFSGEANCYAIIDGQHRSMAALALGFDNVPCAIVDAEPSEAAAIFAAVNGEARKISAVQVFKAALAAGEDWAVAVKAACDAAGVIPLTYPVAARQQKPFSTMATGRMRRILERHGKDFLEAVLRVLMAKPDAQMQGFINVRTMDVVTQDLLGTPNVVRQPLQVAAEMVAGLKSAQVSPQTFSPIAQVQRNTAPLISTASPELVARIADLKARGFTKSMAAASTKARYTLVDSLWGSA